MNCLLLENLKVSENLKELFKYFKLNRRIVDIKDFNLEHAEIYSRDILHKIANHEKGWESQLPEGVAEMIGNAECSVIKKK